MNADERGLNDTTESRVCLLADFGRPKLEIGGIVNKFLCHNRSAPWAPPSPPCRGGWRAA